MKRVLITGASGFLAEQITPFLSKHFEIILGARNLSKLSIFPQYQNLEKRIFDIGDDTTFDNALKKMDVIIHLAAMDFKSCEENPELAQKINVDQVEKFLDSCEKAGVKQFIYFSTIHVNGNNLKGEVTEETPPAPLNSYARTHLEAENLVLKKKFGCVVRLSNSFGHPTDPNSSAWNLVVQDLCRQAVVNRSMIINSNGNQMRDFIPTQNIAIYLENIIDNKLLQTCLLIAQGKSASISEVASTIQNKCQKIFSYSPSIITNSNDQKISVNYQIKQAKIKFVKNFDFIEVADAIEKLLQKKM